MGGVLAIDYGERKCGFAATDALGIARSALGVFRHDGQESALLEHLARLLDERDVSTLLVGLPLHADGTEGTRAAAVRAFAQRLRARFPALEVHEWNEHLTTKEAESRSRARTQGPRDPRRAGQLERRLLGGLARLARAPGSRAARARMSYPLPRVRARGRSRLRREESPGLVRVVANGNRSRGQGKCHRKQTARAGRALARVG